jgi:hypothetical protein
VGWGGLMSGRVVLGCQGPLVFVRDGLPAWGCVATTTLGGRADEGWRWWGCGGDEVGLRRPAECGTTGCVPCQPIRPLLPPTFPPFPGACRCAAPHLVLRRAPRV